MNQAKDDFLVEIGTEELPPKTLQQFANSLKDNLEQELIKNSFSYSDIEYFATPRRIAVYIKNITEYQPDHEFERWGPNVALAYDESGNPTPAALGFARSCHVTLDKLETKNTPKGDCLYFKQMVKGESISRLAPELVKKITR